MIGCGEIAYIATAKSILDSSNAKMMIGMDPVEHIARSFGETYGIKATTQLNDVLNDPDIDAVMISTPHYLHAPLAIQAAKAGKHVMVEKPMTCCDLQHADAMIDACKKAKVLLSVNLNSRYMSSAVKAKELIKKQVIGKVIAINFHVAADKKASYWTGGFSGRIQTDWRKSKKKSGGGILIMNLVHDIDRLHYIANLEVIRVYSEYDTYTTNAEVEDFITVSLRYDNGAIGNVLASSCAKGNESTGNRIYGTYGQIIFSDKLRIYTTKDMDGFEKGKWNEIKTQEVDTGRLFIEQFAQAVFEGKRPDIPGEEGRKVLEVICAAYKSGEIGQPVTLHQV